MRGVLPWASLGLLILAGVSIWQLAQLESVSPQAPVIPTASSLPTSTPDDRIDALVMMAQTQQPTATKTPRPDYTPRPTETPIPWCGDGEIPVGSICDQWSPTPTRTPHPTFAPSPTIAPCPASPAAGDSQRYCWVSDDA
jgi:hypothetical protein